MITLGTVDQITVNDTLEEIYGELADCHGYVSGTMASRIKDKVGEVLEIIDPEGFRLLKEEIGGYDD